MIMRSFRAEYESIKKGSTIFKKETFREVERYASSISFNLQMTSINTFQDTSGRRGGPQACLRRNE